MCNFNGNITIISETPYIKIYITFWNVILNYSPFAGIKAIALVEPVTNQVLFILNVINMIIVDGKITYHLKPANDHLILAIETRNSQTH